MLLEFSQRLKKLRKERNLTQVELANMLNYGYTAIANYESGRNKPRMQDIIRIANILDVSIDYLIGNSDIEYTPKNLWHKKIYTQCKQCGISLKKGDYFLIEMFYFHTKQIIAKEKNKDTYNIDDAFKKMVIDSQYDFFHTLFLFLNNDLYCNIIKNAMSEEWNIKNNHDMS